MFKTAATKIAHNSTIPALAGKQELRPLQDLITAEKAVLISLQKLSVDFSKASEALRTWGLSEGDDLGDILGASTTVLDYFSAALSQYAAHGHGLREQLKTIRTREENLDEMKRRRRAVFRKADDAEKKLSKMSPEHKNLQMQTDLLNRLRDEIRTLDTDIMVEEAALGDFKRTATKIFMGLKFGGLMECCQKGSIAANFGKMITSEISEEKTQPGLHRAFYQGHAKTGNLVAEAQQAVNDVTLSTVPTLAFRDRRQYYNGREGPSPPAVQDEKPMPSVPRGSSDSPEFTPPIRTYVNDSPPSPKSFSQRQNLNPWSQSESIEPRAVPVTREKSSVDDFGLNLVRSNTGPMDNIDGPGGQFATFPIKSRPAAPPSFTLDPLPLQAGHNLGPSFASSIADALEHKDQPDLFADSTPVSKASLPPLPSTGVTPSVSNNLNPWADASEARAEVRKSNLSDNDDALLAYLMSGDDSTSQQSLHLPEKDVSSEVQPRNDREKPLNKRTSMVEDQRRSGSSSLGSPLVAGIMVERDDGSSKIYEEPPSLEKGKSKLETESLSSSQFSSEEQEKALNAAAAREIGEELEALNTSSPKNLSHLQSDPAERGRPRADTGQSYGSSDSGRGHSPLAPPSAPFAKRSISPHPYPEMASPGPSGPPSGSPHGLVGPSFVPLSRPQESQYPTRPLGLSPGQMYLPSRLQPGSSPLSGSPFSEHQSFSMGTLNTSGGLAPGARTISAAAFRKPRNMSMDSLSKGLPGSPYPSPGAGGGPRIFSASAIPSSSASYVPPTQQPENRLSQSGSEYDYIDSYLQPSSPHKAEFSSLPKPEGGYQTGKFSTDLDDSPLR